MTIRRTFSQGVTTFAVHPLATRLRQLRSAIVSIIFIGLCGPFLVVLGLGLHKGVGPSYSDGTIPLLFFGTPCTVVWLLMVYGLMKLPMIFLFPATLRVNERARTLSFRCAGSPVTTTLEQQKLERVVLVREPLSALGRRLETKESARRQPTALRFELNTGEQVTMKNPGSFAPSTMRQLGAHLAQTFGVPFGNEATPEFERSNDVPGAAKLPRP